MKKLFMILAALGFMATATAHAEETMSEKAEATGHSVNRSAKRGANRLKEAICSEGDAKCLAKKGKHRLDEGVDATKDKAHDLKNNIDRE